MRTPVVNVSFLLDVEKPEERPDKKWAVQLISSCQGEQTEWDSWSSDHQPLSGEVEAFLGVALGSLGEPNLTSGLVHLYQSLAEER